MFGWLFGSKKLVKRLKEDVESSFSCVKEDMEKVGRWIKHLNESTLDTSDTISSLKDDLASVRKEVIELKEAVSMIDERVFKQLFKTPKRVLNKQTAVHDVQNVVQTPVQTGVLDSFSLMERALVFILLNSDLKLSYDDLAAMTGKSRATIRGQINSIKQKSEGLVKEVTESNGKKRVYVPDEVKERLLKKTKASSKKRNY